MTESLSCISICCPESCSPYCCRTSQQIAFLMHTACVELLQSTCKAPMSALWDLARSTQPRHFVCDPALQTLGIKQALKAVPDSDLEIFPQKVSATISDLVNMPQELLDMVMDWACPSAALSLITVLLCTRPLVISYRPRPMVTRKLKWSRDIYASYTVVRGQNYLSDLSNEKRRGMRLLHSASSSRPNFALLSVDDLGIRNVLLAPDISDLHPENAPWYRFATLRSDCITVRLNVRGRLSSIACF
jgi:hypothetical protein